VNRHDARRLSEILDGLKIAHVIASMPQDVGPTDYTVVLVKEQVIDLVTMTQRCYFSGFRVDTNERGEVQFWGPPASLPEGVEEEIEPEHWAGCRSYLGIDGCVTGCPVRARVVEILRAEAEERRRHMTTSWVP
jgi:ferredoxin